MLRLKVTNWTLSKSLLDSLVVFLLIVHTHSSCHLSSDDKSNFKIITRAAEKLGTDLMKLISKEGSKNIIISPLSILIPMQIVLYGATHSDKTYREIENYFEYAILRKDPETIHQAMSKMLQCIRQKQSRRHSPKSKSPTNLTMTNVFIAEKEIFNELKPSFKSGVRKYYDIQLERFSQSDEASISRMCNRVNMLISHQTGGAIKRVVDESEMSQQLAAMIMNVAYLKGSWLYKFQNTRENVFYNDGKIDKAKRIPFISRQESFLYLHLRRSENRSDHKFPDFRVVSLPIDSHGISMLILLPDEIDGLSKLYDVKICDIVKQLKKPRQVEVKLPKFTFERKYMMTDYMEQLGMGSVFNHPKLARMFSRQVDFGQIKHKAKINVTEEGVEASAVTQLVLMKSNWDYIDDGPKPIKLVANHPFLFAIVHMKYPAPLFMGQVVSL